MVGPDAVLSIPGSLSPRIRPDPVNDRPAQDIIDKLNLSPSEEKGYYTQTFEDPYYIPYLNRSASTAIYYLLEGLEGESIWHRVDEAEVWHYYAGAPLVLSLSFDDGQPLSNLTLGPDIFDDQQPQAVVQKGEWQRARSLGNWTLVGTTGEKFQGYLVCYDDLANLTKSCPWICGEWSSVCRSGMDANWVLISLNSRAYVRHLWAALCNGADTIA